MLKTELYGLTLATDFDLHGVGDSTDADPDVVVASRPAFGKWDKLPNGSTLLDYWTGDNQWYQLVRAEDGTFFFRIPSICDFAISSDLRQVDLAMYKGAAVGMDSVMTTGALLSLLLCLRGATVLHGSAVEMAGGAIAFIGHSGQGKTTTATMFCAEGASVVTDDVLVVDSPEDQPTVRRGSRELRLRPGTEELASTVVAREVRTSADKRLVLSPQYSEEESLPLRALVIPSPTRDGSPLRFERLSRRNAVFALLSFPRLMGWRDDDVVTRSFEHATALARTTPVVIAHVPWGPPFPADVSRSFSAWLDSQPTS
ncbi:hypothetical protein PU630_01000 [Microbacterium horticulturae]|uniref:Uncharacterized protein n=1 Tax=Microbacterium horticulturae TaxID=3028316 RepID=A0ABY8BZ04_9MICO|nr:hypothetical protein [Microbacterium sp. KACC 23027]WEG09170.1 hypothetical protein PU630_01000 [Microbacterium sp. KACC 23027]